MTKSRSKRSPKSAPRNVGRARAAAKKAQPRKGRELAQVLTKLGSPRDRQKPNKTEACLQLLRRPYGGTIERLQEATGWQAHSVRGFLSGAVRKKLGLRLVSDKPKDGPRRYRISSDRG